MQISQAVGSYGSEGGSLPRKTKTWPRKHDPGSTKNEFTGDSLTDEKMSLKQFEILNQIQPGTRTSQPKSCPVVSNFI